MGKNVLKFGGKSGILPKTKPIFKAPIRPKLEYELAKDKNAEQGYKNVPIPKIKGFNKNDQSNKFLPVSELIQRIQYPNKSLAEINKIENKNERDFLKRAYFRADFLKESFIEEEKRIQEIDVLKQRIYKNQLQKDEQMRLEHVKETSSNSLLNTLPNLTSALTNGMIEPISNEEKELISKQKKLNRNLTNLNEKSKKLEKLLKLYHSASNFIINEEQLEDAIYKAFEVNLHEYEKKKSLIESKLQGKESQQILFDKNDLNIKDYIMGEINGKPGLEQIKDQLNGKKEEYKRQAKVNDM
ncbi:unnamed protein product [Candida verbasci]|uniref:37S ribosomal protein PET123, mitochondrial n=1 Tax=Candida verbasci TaxID=1227364 RepID=A0A9W4XCN4_9ASCO|nr:unnamed protein product [Candida verbasci]